MVQSGPGTRKTKTPHRRVLMTKKKPEEELSTEQKIEIAMAQLDREFGKGAVVRLDGEPQKWPSISTRTYSLDLALGIGGLPKGRVVEIYGAESSGKSTMCLQVVAEAQANPEDDRRCLFIDAEHAIDPSYAKSLGVKLKDMLLAQPSNGEEAIDILERMIRTGGISVAVVDSVAALTPKAELEGDMSTQHMGLHPRLMSKTMRKIIKITSDNNTVVVFTNQLREKVGVVYGNPVIQPGGRALKFAASVRIELKKKEDLKDKDGSIVGSKVEAKVVKNKMAPPFKVCQFSIEYGKGVNYVRCILDSGEDYGVIKKSGPGWYKWKDVSLGQGPDKAVEALASDLEMMNTIKQEIEERAFAKP